MYVHVQYMYIVFMFVCKVQIYNVYCIHVHFTCTCMQIFYELFHEHQPNIFLRPALNANIYMYMYRIALILTQYFNQSVVFLACYNVLLSTFFLQINLESSHAVNFDTYMYICKCTNCTCICTLMYTVHTCTFCTCVEYHLFDISKLKCCCLYAWL